MADPALHGNGEDCPACSLRRADDPWQRRGYDWNRCGGSGRLTFPIEDIVAAHVADARAHYWPQFDQRAAT